MSTEGEYVLGTHDDEVWRLGLQHRVWRPQVLDAWKRAGFGLGQTIIDVGCGCGDATLDLADVVGDAGSVIAIDHSEKYLGIVKARADERGLSNISTHRMDLGRDAMPDVVADGVWNRWALSFVRSPRDVIAQLANRLRPGGRFVAHEYFDYRCWRMAPPVDEVEQFVAAVMRTWRESGGEPDIGLWLPRWLAEAQFQTTDVRLLIEAVRRNDPKWDWLSAFLTVGPSRLEDLGAMNPRQRAALAAALAQLAEDEDARMVTPGVLEILAVKRAS